MQTESSIDNSINDLALSSKLSPREQEAMPELEPSTTDDETVIMTDSVSASSTVACSFEHDVYSDEFH